MLRDIQEGRDKRSDGYLKVDRFARYIREQIPAIKWLWIDTCCIDQTNGQEVSEAINSMFRYYMLSDVCYAYFSDVPPLDNADDGHAKKTCRVVRYARLNLRGLS